MNSSMRFIQTLALPLLILLSLSIDIFAQGTVGEATMKWAIRTQNKPIPDQQLEELGAVDLGQIGSLEGFYTLDFSNSELSPEQIESALNELDDVLWFERQELTHVPVAKDFIGNPTNDPGFGHAWHITNSGRENGKRGEDINLLPVWDLGYTGNGIIVAVVDTGTESTHPDLEANIRPDLSLDLIESQSFPTNLGDDENHGTSVSGIIAAADNEIGGVGVAYRAKIAPIRYIGEAQSDAEASQALSHRNDLISIYNNSWSPSLGGDQDTVAMIGPRTLGRLAIESSVRNGRAGRGNIYLFAAGNDSDIGDSVNYNGYANLREVIPVGAIGNGGKHVSYSERGSSLFVTAPSGGQSLGIYSADRTGAQGYDPSDYTIDFSGTSAATPIVAGLVATMLEARPQLTWRDVQHILAMTAIQVDGEDESWQTNGAGIPVSDKYGFGRVDATAAVQAAIRWQLVDDETMITSSRSVSRTIPNTGSILRSSIQIDSDLSVEHVIIRFVSSHSDWGDLSIRLISPSGTSSVLSYPHDDATGNYSSWDFTTVHCWNENARGTWRLEVSDTGNGGIGDLSSWTLEIYGTEISNSDNHLPGLEPDAYTGTNYPIEIAVLENDSDPDGDPINISSLYQPEFGTLAIGANQSIQYTPLESFQGIDRFGYSVTDPQGATSDTYVTILDPRPVAVTDQVAILQGQNIAIPALENDFDRSGDEVSLVSSQALGNGTAVVQDGHVVYASPPGFIGLEEIAYTITDENDGERSGKIRAFSSGSNDFALYFDGADDFVQVPYHASFDVGSAITLEASFYLTDWGEYGEVGFGRIIDRGAYRMYTNGENHSIYPDHSLVVQLRFPNGGSMNINSPENSIELNRWHTVALSYDGVTYIMFIDGQRVQTEVLYGELGGPIVQDNSDLYIGEEPDGARAFAGLIDWVRIWNVKRENNLLSVSGPALNAGDDKGLVGFYSFNEGVGSATNSTTTELETGTVYEAKWSPKDPSLLSLVFAEE